MPAHTVVEARFTLRITKELNEKLTGWSNRLGISKAQLANMAIQAGLGSIIRAVAPEESMSADKWAEIIKAAQEKGVQIEGK